MNHKITSKTLSVSEGKLEKKEKSRRSNSLVILFRLEFGTKLSYIIDFVCIDTETGLDQTHLISNLLFAHSESIEA